MLKQEDNFVPSSPKRVVYCASGWQGVQTEKVLKHVWFSCCSNTSRQNLSVSNFHTYTSHFINLEHALWRKAPSNKLVKSEIELWFSGIRQSSAIVKPDLSKCRFGRRDGSSSGQKGRRTKGSYTHKLCYPSERHDDVLPLVLRFHWQQAHRDFQHPLQHQLQFRSVSRQQGAFPFKLLPFWNAHKALCQSLTPQSVHFIHVLPHLCSHSFPNRRLSFPFTKQIKWLSVPHSLECLFSKETVVYVKCGIYYYIMHYAGPISRKRLNNVSSEQRIW